MTATLGRRSPDSKSGHAQLRPDAMCGGFAALASFFLVPVVAMPFAAEKPFQASAD